MKHGRQTGLPNQLDWIIIKSLREKSRSNTSAFTKSKMHHCFIFVKAEFLNMILALEATLTLQRRGLRSRNG